MGGPGFSWTKLTPSVARRRWLIVGACACVVLAAVFVARLLADPTIGLGLAVVAPLTAAAASARPRPTLASWVKIDGDGSIWRRCEADAAGVGERLVPTTVSRHLVTFTGVAEPIAIWHDNLSADCFRRLCSHARWHVDRSRQDARPRSDAQPPPA